VLWLVSLVTYSGESVETQMNADERRRALNRITEAVIGCAFRVSDVLGCGFLEKVYENALAVELRRKGLKVQQQHDMRVTYEGVVVGEYTADMLVEDCVIVELKSAERLEDLHKAQCLNYLRASNQRVGLLINFGRPKVEVKRVVSEF
jgi:GxxExxY protein